MNPLVSIIIPTYNRAHLIGETLDSILNQTYTNWECIVVDDASTDGTEILLKEYCKKDGRFQYFKRPIERPKGQNTCRNYGFELSEGDLIKWFDSDDILVKTALENIINSFNNYADGLISLIEYINCKGLSLNRTNSIHSNNIIDDYLVGNIIYFVSGPTWTRDFLLKQKELFDTSISALDDWDFNLRMLYGNPNIDFINQPLIQYRVHENSLTLEVKKLNYNEILSEIRAREKHMNLLKHNNKGNLRIFEKFVLSRYKYFYREAMKRNHRKKFVLFLNFLKKKKQIIGYQGCIVTIIGFIIYLVSKRGYKLLR